MNEMIDKLFSFLMQSGIDARLIVVIIAFLPIAEARLAIPIALKCGLTPFQALCYGFIGSSLTIPILLIALIPLIKYLASTKLLQRMGKSLLTRFENKAEGINQSSDLKKLLGTAAFVAIPLPLTGVWTGCAVASVLNLPYFKAFACVTVGNLLASIIVLIISTVLSEYINFIMAAFALISLLTAITMLIKSFRPKKSV